MEVYVPKHNLGISRSKMPQIKSTKMPDFIKWLKSEGVSVSRKISKAADLKATQREINNSKVKHLADNPANLEHLRKPVVVSKDGYLMDGHHRWMALLTTDANAMIPTIRVGLKIQDLLEMAGNFQGVTRKDLAASILKLAREILK